MSGHRIDRLSFGRGEILCTCGELVIATPEPFFDRDEMLAIAWTDHRKSAGLASKHNDLGFDHSGDTVVWRLHR